MPHLEYKCPNCDVLSVHYRDRASRNDIPFGCSKCETEIELERVYSFSVKDSDSSKKEAKKGDLVKSHIEEAKREVKKEKDLLKKKEYKV